jgi:hypothetical protein
VLATVMDHVSSVAVDDTNVYFTVGLHQVSAVPKAGGAVRTLTTTLPLTFLGTTAMVADGGTLYLAGSDAIYALPTAGGEVTKLTTGSELADSLAIDAEFIYYAERGSTKDLEPHGMIKKIARTGGTPITVAEAQAGPTALTLDDTSIYWENLGSPGPQLTYAKDSGVASVAKSGGNVTVLFKEKGDGTGILPGGLGVVDGGTDIYFDSINLDDFASSGIVRVAKSGGAATIISNHGTMAGFVGGGSLYSDEGTAIVKVDLATKGATKISCFDPAGSVSMAHDATTIYFERSEGEILGATSYTIRALPR